MATVGSLQLSLHLGICKNHVHHRRLRVLLLFYVLYVISFHASPWNLFQLPCLLLQNEIGGSKLQSFNTRLSSLFVVWFILLFSIQWDAKPVWSLSLMMYLQSCYDVCVLDESIHCS